MPHHYFFHFYIVSVLSSLFWGYELLTQSHVLRTVCQNAAVGSPGRSMSMEQIELSCSLLGVQGTRRLVESIVFAKSSASKMWFVHWLIGILFYLAVGISIWIEGAGTLFITCSRDVLATHDLYPPKVIDETRQIPLFQPTRYSPALLSQRPLSEPFFVFPSSSSRQVFNTTAMHILPP